MYTIAKEYQDLLYNLFNEKLFRLEGTNLEVNGLIEEHISKADFIDKSIEILNELGKLMDEDERLK